jgi:hypothetical protein
MKQIRIKKIKKIKIEESISGVDRCCVDYLCLWLCNNNQVNLILYIYINI